jgi:hypothetical protein
MFKAWILPGASSVLYGAMHLMVFYMTVKAHSQVRDYVMQNLDKQVKSCGTNDYVDYGIRMAHAFSPNLPQKLTLPIAQIGMLQTTTTKRTLERQKSCEL